MNDSQSEYDNFDIIDNIEPEQFSYNPSFKNGSTRESLSQIKLPLPSKLQNLKNKKRRYLSSATSIASTSSNVESLYNKHNTRGLNSSLLYRNNRNNSFNLENSINKSINGSFLNDSDVGFDKSLMRSSSM